MNAYERVKSFSLLKHGWHYGDGEPPSPETVNLAIRLLKAMQATDKMKLKDLDALPGIEGEILVRHYAEFLSEEFALLIELDGTISMTREKVNFFEDSILEDAVKGLTEEQAIEQINSYAFSLEERFYGG